MPWNIDTLSRERFCVPCCSRGSADGVLLGTCAFAANSFRTQLRGELQGRNGQRLISHFVLDRFGIAPDFESRSSSQLLSVRAPFPARVSLVPLPRGEDLLGIDRRVVGR